MDSAITTRILSRVGPAFLIACMMPGDWASAQRHSDYGAVTYNSDIAPIIHAKCSRCHRPDQAGPFSLLTYKDVAKRAETIDLVIDSGYMPPWKPVNHEIAFKNSRRLTEPQREKIKQWIASGKPKGKGSEPVAPEFKDGWSLGKPDVVLTMEAGFEVPASGEDIYRSFVFPLQLDEAKWVKAIEYRPTATSSVHHAIFIADSTGNARRMDGSDGKPGIAGMSFLLAPNPQAAEDSEGFSEILKNVNRFRSGEVDAPFAKALGGGLGAYVPGWTATKLPGDLAVSLPAGSDIVMQTHFHPSGKSELEKGKLAVYFADKEPTKKLMNIQIPAAFAIGLGLKVPAGDSDFKISESYTVPTDIELISVGAHAHYICREVSMIARLPDGQQRRLLKIDDWDLDWQDRYYFRDKMILPAGTVIETELTYDNSAKNPENPNYPPREIRWGRESGDEMGSATLQVIAVDEAHRPMLEKSVRRYTIESVLQGDLVELLMQLDTNRDGGLQPTEAPARMQQRFHFLDRDRDGKLTPEELEVLRLLKPKVEGSSNETG